MYERVTVVIQRSLIGAWRRRASHGANANITTFATFPEPDSQFAASVNFIPPSFGVGKLNSEGGSIVVNDTIGQLVSRSRLGFFLGASAGGGSYTPRAEIASQNGAIAIDDIFAFASRFSQSC